MRPTPTSAALLALAACTAEPGPPEPARTRIVFQHFQVPGGAAPLAALVEAFEREHPGIDVVERVLPAASDQQHQFYVTQLEGRASEPDVLALDVIWVPEFARAGWLQPLEELEDEERADFLPAPLAACTVDERLWALPWFADVGLLYFRADLLERHGLAPPETWTQLEEAVRAAIAGEEDPDLHGYLWQGRQYEGLVCVALELLRSNGAAILAEGRSALLTPRALEALAHLRGFVARGSSPPIVAAMDEEGARLLFGGGRALFLRNWPYAWSRFQAPGSPVRGRVGIAALPAFPGGQRVGTLGGWQLGVSRFSRHPEAASALVRHLTSPEAMLALALDVGFAPARRSVFSLAELRAREPFLVRLLPLLEGAVPRPVTPFYPMVSEVLQPELSAIVTGIRGVRTAMERASLQIDHVLALEAE